MQDNDKYQVLSTKVDIDTYKRIKRLERSGKINIYRFGQMFWSTLVRLMDDRHNLSPEMERLMQAFEYCVGWSEAFNTADPGVEKTIGEAIYFLFDAEGKTRGAQPVHVCRPFFDRWTMDYNVSHIIERVLELSVPERYKRMRLAMGEMGCENLLDFIDRLLNIYKDDERYASIRQEFEDCERAENGKPVEYASKTRRKHHVSVDMFQQWEESRGKPFGERADEYMAELERQAQREQKEQEDEESRRWLEDNMPYKPHGYEW